MNLKFLLLTVVDSFLIANTMTLRTVLVPTNVTRVNCVFEQNGDLIPREQLCALWLPRNIALNMNYK